MPSPNTNPRRPDDDSLFQRKTWASDKIVTFLLKWTPKCHEMTHLISEEMDHSLPFYTRLKMRAHYLFCCYCENYKRNLHYLRSVLNSLYQHLDAMPEPKLSTEAKQRIKQALNDELHAS